MRVLRLRAGEGHVVTVRCGRPARVLLRGRLSSSGCPSQVELKTGETYRGTLVEAEDNWNSQMKDITVTGRVRRVAGRWPGRVSSGF